MSQQHSLVVPNGEFEPQGDLNRLQMRAWGVGIVGILAIAVGYFTLSPEDFYRAYLQAWLLCLGVALGLLGIAMLNHVSGGEWGVMLRRVCEASGRTLPFLLLLGIPITFGLKVLYPWARPEVVAHDGLIQHKAAYLNTNGFLIRGVVYFAIWSALAYILSSWSKRHDETGDEAYLGKMKGLSAFGMILYALTGTFASVDWVMSLDPHWFSSLFGIAFLAGHALSAFSFAVPVLVFLKSRKPLSGLVRMKLFHDYGKLMLAFVMVWGYFMVSQYLIIWSGNLPEEITWYIERNTHGWRAISYLLVIGHFAVPFLLLLSADLKKKPKLLMLVAFWLLAMRWLDFYWQIAPSVHHDGVSFSWLDLVAPFGIGGIWVALLIGQFKGRAAVPVREPLLKEVLAHG